MRQIVVANAIMVQEICELLNNCAELMIILEGRRSLEDALEELHQEIIDITNDVPEIIDLMEAENVYVQASGTTVSRIDDMTDDDIVFVQLARDFEPSFHEVIMLVCKK